MTEVNNKTYSDRQEKLVAKHVNGKQVSGSGARPFAPGDVESEDWLIECKTHIEVMKTLTFKRNVWDKIKDEAIVRHRYPAYVVDDGSQKIESQYILFGIHNREIPDDNVTTFESVRAGNINIKIDDFTSSNQILKGRWVNETIYITSLLYFEELFSCGNCV